MALPAAAWFAAHKAAAIGGAGGAALLLVVKKKKKAGGAGAAAGSAASTVAAPAGAAAYNSTAQDVYSSIEPQLAALQQQISQGQTAAAAAPAAPNAFFAKYGAGAWARDAGYARSQGITGLAAPADLAGYGAQRYGQNLYALDAIQSGAPGSTKVPGGNVTVAQTLAEARWADSHPGATV